MADKKNTQTTTKKVTAKGSHGGGNKFNQMKPGTGFAVHDGKPGFSNKKNVK